MAQPHITIQSITGVDIELRIAGAGSRSYAFVIDWHIRLLLAMAWWIVGTMLSGGFAHFFNSDDKLNGSYALTVLLPAVAIYFLYHPILEVVMHGRTPGKRMAGVRIVTRHGDIPGSGALLLRNLFRLIDSLPTFYLVGLTTVVFTEHNVRIGDLAAGTLLIIDNATSEKTFARMGGATTDSQLSVQSIDVIHELLERWGELDETTRTHIARSLLAKVEPDISASALVDLSSNDLRARLKALLPAPPNPR
jgi:uncharacterized RDD family membrane protein YckC